MKVVNHVKNKAKRYNKTKYIHTYFLKNRKVNYANRPLSNGGKH